MHRTMCQVMPLFSLLAVALAREKPSAVLPLLLSLSLIFFEFPGGSGATLRWLKLSEERDIDLLAEMPERLRCKLREADSVSMQSRKWDPTWPKVLDIQNVFKDYLFFGVRQAVYGPVMCRHPFLQEFSDAASLEHGQCFRNRLFKLCVSHSALFLAKVADCRIHCRFFFSRSYPLDQGQRTAHLCLIGFRSQP